MREDYHSNKILKTLVIIYLSTSLLFLILIYWLFILGLNFSLLASLLIVPIFISAIYIIKKNKKKELYLIDLNNRTTEINNQFEERKRRIWYLANKLDELRTEKKHLVEEINKLCNK